MSSSPTTCGVVMASISFCRGIVVLAACAGSGRRASRLEFFEPFDLATIRFDAPRDDERGKRQQNRGRQYDALPQIRIGVEDALRNAPDQLPPERSEEDE